MKRKARDHISVFKKDGAFLLVGRPELESRSLVVGSSTGNVIPHLTKERTQK